MADLIILKLDDFHSFPILPASLDILIIFLQHNTETKYPAISIILLFTYNPHTHKPHIIFIYYYVSLLYYLQYWTPFTFPWVVWYRTKNIHTLVGKITLKYIDDDSIITQLRTWRSRIKCMTSCTSPCCCTTWKIIRLIYIVVKEENTYNISKRTRE